MKPKADILLESGTNELSILEFTIDQHLFGINVAKVQEIMKYSPVNPMQKSNPNVEGVFKPRNEVMKDRLKQDYFDIVHQLDGEQAAPSLAEWQAERRAAGKPTTLQ